MNECHEQLFILINLKNNKMDNFLGKCEFLNMIQEGIENLNSNGIIYNIVKDLTLKRIPG